MNLTLPFQIDTFDYGLWALTQSSGVARKGAGQSREEFARKIFGPEAMPTNQCDLWTRYEVECSLDGLFEKKWLYRQPFYHPIQLYGLLKQLNTVRVRKYNALPCLSGKKGGGASIVLYIVFLGKGGGANAPCVPRGYAPV